MKIKERELHLNAPYLHFKGNFYRPTHRYQIKELLAERKIEDFKLLDDHYIKYNQRCINCENDQYVDVYFHKWNSDMYYFYHNDFKNELLIFDKKGNLITGDFVVYIPLYKNKDAEMFIRDYNEFMSPVDKNKYPNENQKWRFQYNGPQNFTHIE